MEPDLLVALTNFLLIVATGGLIYVSVRDAHHHEEKMAELEDAENERLVKVIDKTITEHEKYEHGGK
jgi:hypothetical protein